MERTLVLIKPDGVERKLIGEIISYYERKGLTISQMKMTVPDVKLVEEHYEEHKGKSFFNELVDYLSHGKVVAMVVEGNNVVEIVRKINGNKDPLKSECCTIRGTFANDTTQNLVHSSDSVEHAEREISIWF
ncbi:MAG: nucleoside-diphosphate kinase [Clostridiaceae bacterium]